MYAIVICMNRRRKSVIPEIKIIAPSVETGLDESLSQISYQNRKLSFSSEIYRSNEEDTRSYCSRYYLIHAPKLDFISILQIAL